MTVTNLTNVESFGLSSSPAIGLVITDTTTTNAVIIDKNTTMSVINIKEMNSVDLMSLFVFGTSDLVVKANANVLTNDQIIGFGNLKSNDASFLSYIVAFKFLVDARLANTPLTEGDDLYLTIPVLINKVTKGVYDSNPVTFYMSVKIKINNTNYSLGF